MGLMSAGDHDDIVRAEYENYARTPLVQLRRVREGTTIEEDHMRNRQMIVHWLMANTKAIERRVARRQDVQRDGRCEGIPQTASPGCSQKCSGSRQTATMRPRRRCSRAYGVHFDPKLRDEIVARVDKLNLPSYTGFVQPKLEPVREATARFAMCKISYPLDLTTQMLEYSDATRASREQFRARASRRWCADVLIAPAAVGRPQSALAVALDRRRLAGLPIARSHAVEPHARRLCRIHRSCSIRSRTIVGPLLRARAVRSVVGTRGGCRRFSPARQSRCQPSASS